MPSDSLRSTVLLRGEESDDDVGIIDLEGDLTFQLGDELRSHRVGSERPKVGRAAASAS
jgi:hypothetical protein